MATARDWEALPDEEKLAYLAGVFDAEGCVHIARYIRKGKGYDCYFTLCVVGMCNREIPTLFRETFGGTVTYRRPQRNRIESWHWRIAARSAGNFLRAILPYLVIKRIETEKTIAFQSRRKATGFRKSPSEVILDRIAYQEIRDIKQTQRNGEHPEANSISLAYYAGMFDGEGCILIGQDPRCEAYSLKCQLRIANETIPSIFQSRFGGVKGFSAQAPPRKDQWFWISTTRHAGRLLESILPWLIAKRSEAILAINFQKRKVYCGMRGRSATNLALDRDAFQRIKSLKLLQGNSTPDDITTMESAMSMSQQGTLLP